MDFALRRGPLSFILMYLQDSELLGGSQLQYFD
jgi:hypothetical protein